MRNKNLAVRRNVCNNKQALVESIMTKIAPIVERALNETDETLADKKVNIEFKIKELVSLVEVWSNINIDDLEKEKHVDRDILETYEITMEYLYRISRNIANSI